MSQSHSTEMIVIIRPSFKKICGDDACRAALFNHFLYWIARKAEDQPHDKVKRGEIYWYGSAEQICDEGLDNSWSVNKVRKEVNALVAAGLIGQRHNPVKKWDQTMHYFIGDDQGKVIREQFEKHHIYPAHLGLSDTAFHLLNLVNAFTKCGDSNCQICEIELPNMADRFTKNGNAIPKVSTKVSSKDNLPKDTAKKEERTSTPSTQSSQSQFTPEEQEMLQWLEEEQIKISRVAATVKGQLVTLIPGITTKEMLHKYCVYVADDLQREHPDKKIEDVALGNLAKEKRLNAFLDAEKVDEQFGLSPSAQAVESAPESQIEALESEVQPIIPSYLIKAIREALSRCAAASGDQVLDADISYAVEVWQYYGIPPLIFKQLLEEVAANTRAGIESMLNTLASKAEHYLAKKHVEPIAMEA